MKVFISWSGSRSQQVASLLDSWLSCVIQAIDPWMSSKDIDRGSLWFSEISDQLKDTTVGIVCLTKSNKEKPWILFEAGALAKGLSSQRVCTFLIDLDSTEVGNPLAQFNHTMPSKEGLYSLVRTLNVALGPNTLNDDVLNNVFDTYWPQFENNFESILENADDEHVQDKRSKEDILFEVLRTVRGLDRKVRNLEQSQRRDRALSKNLFRNVLSSNDQSGRPSKEQLLQRALDALQRFDLDTSRVKTTGSGSGVRIWLESTPDLNTLNFLHEEIARHERITLEVIDFGSQERIYSAPQPPSLDD